MTVTNAWMIDELAYAGPEHLDADFVAGYDRKQGYPDPEQELADFEAHGLGPESVLVDLGAGTGQFALPAARRFGQVMAVDISPVMVRKLTERAAEDGLANLRTVRAGFLSYEHQGPLADGVYTRHALHQLPDFWKTIALGRIAGLLRPGGVLGIRDLIYDFRPDDADAVFQAWFDNAATDPAAGYTSQDYIDHIRTEFSTYRWLFEPMLAAAGFEIVSVRYHARCFGEYTCIKTGD
jgi:SAM-dependent methyltransferase